MVTRSYHRYSLPALPDVLATPPPRRDEPAPVHLLGSPSDAVDRISTALRRLPGLSISTRVPLAALGVALVAPTGGAFDDGDPVDRMVLVRLLAAFSDRFWARGWDVTDLPFEPPAGHLVTVARCPRNNELEPRHWPAVASRWTLARWARRAAPDPEPAAVDVAAALPAEALSAEALSPGRALVERIKAHRRAAGLPWPPPVNMNDGPSVDARRRA